MFGAVSMATAWASKCPIRVVTGYRELMCSSGSQGFFFGGGGCGGGIKDFALY